MYMKLTLASERFEFRSLPPTPHKHLNLWGDHRAKGAWW